jgi:ribonuclease HI
MSSYYAIARGRKVGIYTNWNDAKKQIDGFRGAKYKKFATQQEAKQFIDDTPVVKQTTLEAFFKPEGDPQETDRLLIVFTDGSAIQNVKASFATIWPYHEEMNFGCRLGKNEQQTNNRAEYHAVIHALKQADELDPNREKTLNIYTDSELLINSMTKWLPAWKKNNWKKSDGDTVMNLDLVQTLDEQLSKRRVAFKHVRAHTGADTWYAKYNDKADKLARGSLNFPLPL